MTVVDDMIPQSVARDQAAWERKQAIRRAASAGLSLDFIARKLGLSRTRVRQLLTSAEMSAGKRAPLQRFLESKSHLREIAKFEQELQAEKMVGFAIGIARHVLHKGADA